jgi:hypothetical protein
MAPNPFTKYANAIALRENAMQTNAANISNMSGALQDVAAQTGAGTINPNEIPVLGAVSNQTGTIKAQSDLRIKQSKATSKRMPNYVSGYRSYLQWRYPTRYGGGGSGTGTSTNSSYGYNIPALGDPTGFGGIK